MRLGRSLALPSVLLALSCAELPDIPHGVCGNGIVEPSEDAAAPGSEDCDRFARKGEPGTVCRAPDQPMACHFDCTKDATGAGPACPKGWACGSDATCRPPSGTFMTAGDPFGADARWIQPADFDGDGRSELVTSGNASLSVHFFGAEARVASSLALPPRRLPPAVGSLSDGSRSDLAFVLDELSGIGILLGGSDRSLTPKAYPTIALQPGIGARFVTLLDLSATASKEGIRAAVLSDKGGGNAIAIERVRVNAGERQVVGDIPGQLSDVQIAVGHLREDPRLASCRDVVIGFLGQQRLYVWNPCQILADGPQWNTAAPTPIDLPPTLLLQRGLTLYDANADGHLDVVIPAQRAGEVREIYAVYSDGEGGYLDGVSQPAKLPVPQLLELGDLSGVVGESILALGDIDGRAIIGSPAGDPSLDLVTDLGVFLRDGKGYRPAVQWAQAPPTEAVIGDFNRDGLLDIVAGSNKRIGVDYYAAVRDSFTAATFFNRFVSPTDAFVEHLAIGDFDGDFVNDLVLSQIGAGADGSDVPSILFGRIAGSFDRPVRLGELGKVRQVVPDDLPLDNADRMTDLAVLSESLADDASGRVASLSAFLGNGDRLLFSPFGLVSKKLDRGDPLRTAIGHFAEGPALVTLATNEVWISPSTEGGNMTTSLRTEQMGVAKNTLLTTADLDGDGSDEVILAMTAGSCGADQAALVTGIVDNGVFSPRASASGCVDGPIPGTGSMVVAQLGAADVDGDGALDLLFLGGVIDKDVQRLRIVWNDGHGGLDFAHPAVIGLDTDIKAFTTVMAEVGMPHRVIVTSKGPQGGGTFIVGATKPLARSLGEPRKLDGAIAGISVAAGDFDGDGLADLAIADAQQIQILRQQRGR
jgi:hypothetical protein